MKKELINYQFVKLLLILLNHNALLKGEMRGNMHNKDKSTDDKKRNIEVLEKAEKDLIGRKEAFKITRKEKRHSKSVEAIVKVRDEIHGFYNQVGNSILGRTKEEKIEDFNKVINEFIKGNEILIKTFQVQIDAIKESQRQNKVKIEELIKQKSDLGYHPLMHDKPNNIQRIEGKIIKLEKELNDLEKQKYECEDQLNYRLALGEYILGQIQLAKTEGRNKPPLLYVKTDEAAIGDTRKALIGVLKASRHPDAMEFFKKREEIRRIKQEEAVIKFAKIFPKVLDAFAKIMENPDAAKDFNNLIDKMVKNDTFGTVGAGIGIVFSSNTNFSPLLNTVFTSIPDLIYIASILKKQVEGEMIRKQLKADDPKTLIRELDVLKNLLANPILQETLKDSGPKLGDLIRQYKDVIGKVLDVVAQKKAAAAGEKKVNMSALIQEIIKQNVPQKEAEISVSEVRSEIKVERVKSEPSELSESSASPTPGKKHLRQKSEQVSVKPDSKKEIQEAMNILQVFTKDMGMAGALSEVAVHATQAVADISQEGTTVAQSLEKLGVKNVSKEAVAIKDMLSFISVVPQFQIEVQNVIKSLTAQLVTPNAENLSKFADDLNKLLFTRKLDPNTKKESTLLDVLGDKINIQLPIIIGGILKIDEVKEALRDEFGIQEEQISSLVGVVCDILGNQKNHKHFKAILNDTAKTGVLDISAILDMADNGLKVIANLMIDNKNKDKKHLYSRIVRTINSRKEWDTEELTKEVSSLVAFGISNNDITKEEGKEILEELKKDYKKLSQELTSRINEPPALMKFLKDTAGLSRVLQAVLDIVERQQKAKNKGKNPFEIEFALLRKHILIPGGIQALLGPVIEILENSEKLSKDYNEALIVLKKLIGKDVVKEAELIPLVNLGVTLISSLDIGGNITQLNLANVLKSEEMQAILAKYVKDDNQRKLLTHIGVPLIKILAYLMRKDTTGKITQNLVELAQVTLNNIDKFKTSRDAKIKIFTVGQKVLKDLMSIIMTNEFKELFTGEFVKAIKDNEGLIKIVLTQFAQANPDIFQASEVDFIYKAIINNDFISNLLKVTEALSNNNIFEAFISAGKLIGVPLGMSLVVNAIRNAVIKLWNEVALGLFKDSIMHDAVSKFIDNMDRTETDAKTQFINLAKYLEGKSEITEGLTSYFLQNGNLDSLTLQGSLTKLNTHGVSFNKSRFILGEDAIFNLSNGFIDSDFNNSILLASKDTKKISFDLTNTTITFQSLEGLFQIMARLKAKNVEIDVKMDGIKIMHNHQLAKPLLESQRKEENKILDILSNSGLDQIKADFEAARGQATTYSDTHKIDQAKQKNQYTQK